jgi:transcriptional/translational regulatory protein YebC/TACO1
MGEAGCVSWLFHKRSLIVVPKDKMGEDQLMELALNAGADDLKDEGDNWSILSPPEAHEAVLQAVQKAGITPAVQEVTMIPQTQVKLEGKQAQAMLRMSEAFEEHEDVQNVYANFDIEEDEMEAVG